MKKIFKLCLVFFGLLITTSFGISRVTAENTEHSHIYDNGICSCGDYQKPKWNQTHYGGWVISNAGELLWYQENFNKGEVKENMLITSDITLPDNVEWVPIGTLEYPFNNDVYTIDNKTFTIDLNNQTVKKSNYGFIGYADSKDTDSVKILNIKVKVSFVIDSAISSVGGIVGSTNGSVTIQNVTNAVSISTTENAIGSTKVGGIIGSSNGETDILDSSNYGDLNLDGVYESVGGIVGIIEQGMITSCANYGMVSSNSAKYLGGLVGYASNSLFGGVKSSINIGNVTGKSFNISLDGSEFLLCPSDLCGYIYDSESFSFENNYYVGEIPYGNCDFPATKTNEEELNSGKIAYLLGNSFGQIIDDDTKEQYPTIGSKPVYQVYLCDETTIKYSNTNQNDTHVFTYIVQDNKITQHCVNCLQDKVLEIVVPSELYYDKTIKEVTLFTDIEGLNVDDVEVIYDREVKFPGTYTATITYLGLTATLDFEVKKGIPELSMFDRLTIPELVYNGLPQQFDLYETTEPGMGEIKVRYGNGENKYDHPTNAGLYSVELSVEEGKYYQAHTFNILELFDFITVKPKEITIEWTNTTLFYDENKMIQLPEYKFIGTLYNELPKTSFTNYGKEPGEYTTTISLTTGNYILVGDNLTVNFVIKPILVPTPVINGVLFQEGVNQIADITDTELYRVIQNNGGTSHGVYPVVLELIDGDKYTWESTDDSKLTLYFYIHLNKVNWIEEPTIENWAYGEEPNKPSYKVDNELLNFTIMYRPVGGTFTNIVPTEIGDYEVIIISEKNDARVYPLDDVILPFSITKANPDCGIESFIDVNYGTTLKDIELIGYGDGKWSYVDEVDTLLEVGTHEIKVKFTPFNNRIYNEIEKTIKITVNKLPIEYTSPLPIENLTYNGDYQLVVQPGSVIYGTLYYSINDGDWQTTLPIIKNAGTYQISYKIIGDSHHFDVDVQSFEVTINKASLTITGSDLTVEQYKSLPELTYSISGLMKGDILTQNPTLVVEVQNTDTVGTYSIVVSNASIENYNISYLPGTLTITEHTTCIGGTPTCTSGPICEVCKKEYGNKLDHNFEHYIYNNDGTCTSLGTETSKCTHCDETNTRDRTEGNLLEHSFDVYTSNNDGTCLKEETLSSKCEHCEAVKKITVPNSKKDHLDNNSDHLCDTCGVSIPKESSKLCLGILIGSLPVVGVGALLYFFVFKKKITKK